MKKKKQSRELESKQSSFEVAYPNIAAWVSNGGWVEVGYVDYTGSFVRALDEGGMVWEGLRVYESLDYALKDLDQGIGGWIEVHG